jgi:hypothetical protein
MKLFLITILTGTIAGVIDIMPMIKMKLDKHAIISAFVFYFTLPFFIFNTSLFGSLFWFKGTIIGFVLALPVIIIVAKDDKKAAVPMVVMSALLGTLMGVVQYFL